MEIFKKVRFTFAILLFILKVTNTTAPASITTTTSVQVDCPSSPPYIPCFYSNSSSSI